METKQTRREKPIQQKQKAGIVVNVIERYDAHKGVIRKIRHSGPG